MQYKGQLLPPSILDFDIIPYSDLNLLNCQYFAIQIEISFMWFYPNKTNIQQNCNCSHFASIKHFEFEFYFRNMCLSVSVNPKCSYLLLCDEVMSESLQSHGLQHARKGVLLKEVSLPTSFYSEKFQKVQRSWNSSDYFFSPLTPTQDQLGNTWFYRRHFCDSPATQSYYSPTGFFNQRPQTGGLKTKFSGLVSVWEKVWLVAIL